LGKRHLDNAIHKYTTDNPNASVTVCWHPYIIDKNTAKHGENYMDYNIRRWGSDEWTQSLRNSGRRIGLEFRNWQTWPNTVHAHRLVHLAGQQKGPVGQNAAKDLLFHMIYEDGRNISEIETLIEAAHQLQLENADEYLKSNKDIDVILSEDMNAKTNLKISGVPFFTVRDKQMSYTLSGAQSSDNFLKAFSQLKIQ
jgi:predicted DsbA family dithiol-disulfide isomerase